MLVFPAHDSKAKDSKAYPRGAVSLRHVEVRTRKQKGAAQALTAVASRGNVYEDAQERITIVTMLHKFAWLRLACRIFRYDTPRDIDRARHKTPPSESVPHLASRGLTPGRRSRTSNVLVR